MTRLNWWATRSKSSLENAASTAILLCIGYGETPCRSLVSRNRLPIQPFHTIRTSRTTVQAKVLQIRLNPIDCVLCGQTMSPLTLPRLTNRPSPLWGIAAILLLISCISFQSASMAAESPSPTTRGWKMAEVTADSALIHQTPNGVSFITGTVQRGDLIWIKNVSEDSEWVLIRPTEGSVSWILQSDISELRTGEGRVKSAKALIRPGRMGARLPGPPGMEIQKGTTDRKSTRLNSSHL